MPSEMLGRGGCTQTGQRPRESGQGWVGCSGARKAGMSWCWGGARGRKGAGKGQLSAGGGREATERFPPFRCRGSAALCLEGKNPEKSEVKALVTQSGLTLRDPVDCSPPGPSVHRILQARILEWAAVPSFRGSSRPRDQT